MKGNNMEWLKTLFSFDVHNIIQVIPFICLVDGKVHLNTARITEMFLGAIVIASFSAYILLQVLNTKFEMMEKQLTEVKAQVTYTNSRIDNLLLEKRREDGFHK